MHARTDQSSVNIERGSLSGAMAGRNRVAASGRRASKAEAPVDMKDCGVGCYVWGKTLPVAVDILVLGNSLKEHGNKTDRFLCISDDTSEMNISNLFLAFWRQVRTPDTTIGPDMLATRNKHLIGVHSKFNAMAVFSKKPYKKQKLLFLDGDMLVRSNIDDLFTKNVPAAVIREREDDDIFETQTGISSVWSADEESSAARTVPVNGGVNGGLVLFEPDAHVMDEMYEQFTHFRPVEAMMEQEFIGWYWNRNEEWNAIDRKNNFQIKQMYLACPTGGREPPKRGSFSDLVDHPEEIRIFHFNGRRKPSRLLIEDMPSVQGWLELETKVGAESLFMLMTQTAKTPYTFERKEWIEKTMKLGQAADLEWLEAWKRTYVSVISFVVMEAYQKMFRNGKSGTEHHVTCEACGAWFDIDDVAENMNIIRDHILFNCESMAATVCIPAKFQTNLKTFFFVPCGEQVESKLTYLSEVHEFYLQTGSSRYENKKAFPLQPEMEPHILLPNYTIPASVLAITEDIGLDAAFVNTKKENRTEKAVMRQYERAMRTLQKNDMWKWKEDGETESGYGKTLENALTSATWLHEYHMGCRDRQDKAAGVSTASCSASSSNDSHLRSKAKPSLPGGTPPWRQDPIPGRGTPQPKARPVHAQSAKRKNFLCPPPPEPPRRQRP